MAIQFFTDKIKIGDFTLYEGNGGLQFDGVVRAENFQKVPTHQGFSYGYVAGGRQSEPGFPTPQLNTIEKFPFASDATSTSVGNKTVGTIASAGHNSETHGYVAGGYGSVPGAAPLITRNNIEKFPFAVDTNASDVADMSEARTNVVGVSSYEHGYIGSGTVLPPGGVLNSVDKFPFISDNNATDVFDLTDSSQNSAATAASSTHGFVAGGGPGGSQSISKFPFATDVNAVGNGALLSGKRQMGGGNSSGTHGYLAGGTIVPGPNVNSIEKWPFSTSSGSSDVGDLTNTIRETAKQSSLEYGYSVGGLTSPTTYQTTIDKFPFATDNNAVAQTNGLSSARGLGTNGSTSI